MKSKITAFIDTLSLYDYALFGGVFVVFILVIILALIARKRILSSIFLILLAFAILFLGPTLGRKMMYDYLYKNTVTITSEKQLQFCDAIVVKGTLKNESKKDFKVCKIEVLVHKVSTSTLRNYVNNFKHIDGVVFYEEDISKGQEIKFKAIIEPFKYKKKYSLSIGANCK